MAYIQTPDERVFAQVTHPWAATVPNSTGTATVAASDVVRHSSCRFIPGGSVIQSAGKTGSRGRMPALPGRTTARYEAAFPLAGSGTAGTVGDLDPILQAIFGQAGTVVSGTSVTYSFAAAVISALTLFRYQDPNSTYSFQEILAGGVVDTVEFAAGPEGEVILTIAGPAFNVIPKPNFASLDTAGKAGLSAFPAEPSSPSYLGTSVVSHRGSVTINGSVSDALENIRIRMSLNRSLRAPFGSNYSKIPVAGLRDITVDFSLFEDDSSAQAALRRAAVSKDPIDITLQLGEVAGNIFTIPINNLVLPQVEKQDGGVESLLQFNGCAAGVSAAGANDEIALICA